MNERDETFFCCGGLFDIPKARKLATFQLIQFVRPHRAIVGVKVKLKEQYDLRDPVLFASFTNKTGELGVLMIDGNHRMQYAAQRKEFLAAIFLPPWATEHILFGMFSPSKWFWKKMELTARLYGLRANKR